MSTNQTTCRSPQLKSSMVRIKAFLSKFIDFLEEKGFWSLKGVSGNVFPKTETAQKKATMEYNCKMQISYYISRKNCQNFWISVIEPNAT
jgi:hypothetical protein